MNENNEEVNIFFKHIGEIWRDITSIEFLMRMAICIHKKQEKLFPKTPYLKGKEYEYFPDSFNIGNFEKLVTEFNNIFSDVQIPIEFVELRHAMAHGVISKLDGSDFETLVKFKTFEGKLKIDFVQDLDSDYLLSLNSALSGVRRLITLKIIELKTTEQTQG